MPSKLLALAVCLSAPLAAYSGGMGADQLPGRAGSRSADTSPRTASAAAHPPRHLVPQLGAWEGNRQLAKQVIIRSPSDSPLVASEKTPPVLYLAQAQDTGAPILR